MKGFMKISVLILFLAVPVWAQQAAEPNPEATTPRRSRTNDSQRTAASTNAPTAGYVDESPAVTHHEIQIPSKKLKYTATAAQMPIMNGSGETEAHIFYIAYTLEGISNVSQRPLTFAFNGGPGSASIWVHMGAMGPKRAKLLDNGGFGVHRSGRHRVQPREDAGTGAEVQ
jgi:carboxypeptidase C (cathepsin A)